MTNDVPFHWGQVHSIQYFMSLPWCCKWTQRLLAWLSPLTIIYGGASEVPAFQPLFSTSNPQMVGVFPIGKSSSGPYFLGLHVETWGTTKQLHFIAVGFGMVCTWKTQTKDHRVVPEYGRESILCYHVLLIPNTLLELSKCIFSGRFVGVCSIPLTGVPEG